MKNSIFICFVFIALILKFAPDNSGASVVKNKQISPSALTETAMADEKPTPADTSVLIAEKKRPDAAGTARVSYYAHQFHGRTTANGERFNMHALTAASKTLPFGARVHMYNPTNGKSVWVRINDRGPYVGDRKFDLSLEAAKRLGIVKAGTANVRYQVFLLEKKKGRKNPGIAG